MYATMYASRIPMAGMIRKQVYIESPHERGLDGVQFLNPFSPAFDPAALG